MSNINAFVGHSFNEADADTIRQFLIILTTIQGLNFGFSWDHAEAAEPKVLSQKVREKMEGKNLFVGICTKRESIAETDNVKPCLLMKNMVKINKSHIKEKTSDWIIQEIGYAVAKGMSLLLLLEEGVRLPGGLQGDVEFISFNRKAVEKSYPKILEMIKTMRPVVTEPASVTSGPLQSSKPQQEPEGTAKSSTSSLPDERWTFRDYLFQLRYAIIMKDEKRATAIYEAFQSTKEWDVPERRVQWKAGRLLADHIYGKKDNLNDLLTLQKENPANPHVQNAIGEIRDSYDQFGLAAEAYSLAAQCSVNSENKLWSLCDAALSSAKNNDVVKAHGYLEECRIQADSVSGGKEILLSCLSDIATVHKDDDSFITCCEALLRSNPDDLDRRFKLAYKYSELGENDLALYHYRIHAQRKPTENVWNNIGVAAANLTLPIRAVKAYRKAEELGETLAMSNLAHKFINEGFIEEANELCTKATAIKGYAKQIGTAIVEIQTKPKAEEDREEAILRAAIGRREFYSDYAVACTKKSLQDCEGEWGTWRADMKSVSVVIKGGTFTATTVWESSLGGIIGGRGLGLVPPEVLPKMKNSIKYTGHVSGHSVQFSKVTQKEFSQEETTSGLLFFSDDLKEIHICEKGTNAEKRLSTLVRIS